MVFFTCAVLLSHRGLNLNGSRTIGPEENCPPNCRTNPNLTPNPNRGTIFLGVNCLVASNPKTNPNIHPKPNPYRAGGNCPDTSLNKINVFCLLITDYDITKKLKIKEKITSQILCLSI